MNKRAINPVTIRSQPPYPQMQAVIGRMSLGVLGNMMRVVQIMVIDPAKDPQKNPDAFSLAIVPEELFLQAIGHVFPRGELAEVHLDGQPSRSLPRNFFPDLPGEIKLGQPQKCQLGVGNPVITPGMLTLTLHLARFGVDEPLSPTASQLERLLMLPGVRLDDAASGPPYALKVNFDDPTDMALRLPSIEAQVWAILEK